MGDSHVGLLPRLMSKALRKLSGVTNKSQTCVIFTNQIRQKIGIMFGNPDTTPGGLALKFHASVRLELRRGSQIKEGDEILEAACVSKSRKIKWHRLSRKQSTTLPSGKVSPKKEISWILLLTTNLSRKAALGFHTTMIESAKADRTPRNIWRTTLRSQQKLRRRYGKH